MKTNHILALLAIIVGLTAAFTRHSARNNFYPLWKFEAARIGDEKVDFISATHLADILYQKEQGFIVLDLRDDTQYESYHIPSALQYNRGDQVPGLEEKRFIVYGQSSNGHLKELTGELPGKVLVLKGGIAEWYAMVLFPDFTQYKVRNNEILERIVTRSRYFGGKPVNMQLLNIRVRESRYREGC